MAGVQTVSFVNPADPIGQQMQMQEVQRRQALADALRQQSLEALPTNQGPLSIWQGVAKLADAIASNHINRQAQRMGYDVSARGANALATAMTPAGQPVRLPYDPNQNPYATNEQGRNFGQRLGDFIRGGAPVGQSPMGQPAQPAPPVPNISPAIAPSQQAVAPGPNAQPQLPAPSSPGVAAAPVADPSPATGQMPAPQSAPMPQAPQQPQGPVGTGALSLTGNPQIDMPLMMTDPGEYNKALIAAHTPTDFVKTLIAANIDPNSPIGRQLIQQQAFKQNYVAPENARGGSWTTDPLTGRRTYNPTLPEGSAPQFGPNGEVLSVSAIPGAAAVEGTMSGAKAGGTAAAQAPYELVDVTGPDGKPYKVPKSYITGGASAPTPAGKPGGGLNDFYKGDKPGNGVPTNLHGGAPAGLSPAERAAQEQAAKNSADAFNAAIANGETSKQTRFQLRQLLQEAEGLQTGVGAQAISGAKSFANTVNDNLLGGVLPHFSSDVIAKYDSIKKLGAQLAGSAGGGTATDARLKNAIDAIPNAHYAPAAFHEVGILLDAKAAADQARSQAAARWMQRYGPESYPKFAATWQTVENPDVFYHVAKGDFAQWAKGMSPTARAKAFKEYGTYKALGAF